MNSDLTQAGKVRAGLAATQLPSLVQSNDCLDRNPVSVPLKSSSHVKRIALSFPLRSSHWQEIVRGVYRFAEVQKSWMISFHNEEDVSTALAGKPDGVIAMIQTAQEVCTLQAWGGFVVDASCELEDSPFIQIGFDPLATGMVAADHLMALPGRAYACAGDTLSSTEQKIARGFVERLHQAGLDAIRTTFSSHDSSESTALRNHDVLAWLAELPKPAAIFALNDSLAHSLARSCFSAGLRVPQDIAILGCSNDEFLCSVSQPPLSSVSLPYAALGYEAAKLLDSIMSSVEAPRRKLLPPLGAITRQSTDPAAQAEPALAAALRFIRENLTGRIGVDDIAEASGMSRSSLERRFRAVVGRSPLAELVRERVERAQHLLVNSELSIKEIAKVAGFHDVRHLSVTFRIKTGLTPSKYRTRFRPG